MNMSYVFFDDILSTLHKRVMFDAVANYAGNSFFEKSWDVIEENNPFNKTHEKSSGVMKSLAGFVSKSNVQRIKTKRTAKEAMSSPLD